MAMTEPKIEPASDAEIGLYRSVGGDISGLDRVVLVDRLIARIEADRATIKKLADRLDALDIQTSSNSPFPWVGADHRCRYKIGLNHSAGLDATIAQQAEEIAAKDAALHRPRVAVLEPRAHRLMSTEELGWEAERAALKAERDALKAGIVNLRWAKL